MKMKRLLLFLGILSLVLALSPAAYSQNATGNLGVYANAIEVCHVRTTPITFIDYDNSDQTAYGRVEVNCTFDTDYSIALNEGIHPDTVNSIRQMSDGHGHRLAYEIYDPSDNLWGDDTGVYGTEYGILTGNGNWQTYNARGEVAGLQGVAPGDYSDTVKVTIIIE